MVNTKNKLVGGRGGGQNPGTMKGRTDGQDYGKAGYCYPLLFFEKGGGLNNSAVNIQLD